MDDVRREVSRTYKGKADMNFVVQDWSQRHQYIFFDLYSKKVAKAIIDRYESLG